MTYPGVLRKNIFSLLYIIFLIVLIAACYYISTHKLLWLDEYYSLLTTQDPDLKNAYNGMLAGVNATPPVYFVVTKLLYWLGFWNPLYFRLFSCLCLLTGLTVVYRALKSHLPKDVIICSIIITVGGSQLIILQNSEFRFYTFFFMIEAIAFAYALRYIQRPKNMRSLIFFSFFLSLGVLTHIYGVIYAGVFLAAFLIYDVSRKKFDYKPVVASLLAIASIAIWFTQLKAQAASGEPHSWISMPDGRKLITSISQFFPAGTRLWFIITPVLLGLLIFISVYFYKNNFKKISVRSNTSPEATYLHDGKWFLIVISFCFLFIPPILSFIVSHISTVIFLERYFIPSYIGSIILISMNLSFLLSKWRNIRVLNIVTASICVIGLVMLVFNVSKFEDESKMTLTHIEDQTRDERHDIIFEQATDWIIANQNSTQFNSYFPLDWEIASDSSNGIAAPSVDKQMMALKRYYHFDAIQPTSALLIPGKIYYVVGTKVIKWVEINEREGRLKVLEEKPLPQKGLLLTKIEVL